MLALRTILVAAAAVLVMAAPAAAADYEAQITSFCCYETLEPGDKVVQFLEVKNIGAKTWFRDGAIPVRLGSSDPFDRASPFFTDGDWMSPARVTGLDVVTIDPGETGRFNWVATAPADTGEYVEHYTPLAEGIAWMNAGDVYYWKYNVIPAQAPTVHITASPARVKRGETLSVSADATDNRKVAKVAFSVGTQVVTADAPTQGTSGYSATLSSAELPAGTHSVTVTAYDPGGRTSTATSSFEVYEVPPPPPVATRIPPFTPLFATRSGRNGRLGALVGIGSVQGLRPGSRLRLVCTYGCVRRVNESRKASKAGRTRLTLKHSLRVLKTTRIELRVSLAGYVTRFQTYRFRATRAGTLARYVKSGCLASEKPRKVVRCPAF